MIRCTLVPPHPVGHTAYEPQAWTMAYAQFKEAEVDQLLARLRKLKKPNPDLETINSATIACNALAHMQAEDRVAPVDRKSTRLNSSHSQISYAVYRLKINRQSHLRDHLFRSTFF